MILRFDIDSNPIYPTKENIVIPALDGRYANCEDALAKGAADEREKWAEERALMEAVIEAAGYATLNTRNLLKALHALGNFRNTRKGAGWDFKAEDSTSTSRHKSRHPLATTPPTCK
jgi:hypothetical protein